MSEVNVHTVDEGSSDGPSEEPALPWAEDKPAEMPDTPLMGLAAKLQAVRADLFIDLQVPRAITEMLDHPFKTFVRYTPIDSGYMAKTMETWQKSKRDDWRTVANAQVLAHHCTGVFVIDSAAEMPIDYVAARGDGLAFSLKPDDPDAPWTRFDPDLALTLGESVPEAVAVCRRLYRTTGDLDMALTALIDWSAQTPEEAARGFKRP